ERPVIAAGSTGSIPATAELLKAIATLPRGAVVLPGLDRGLTTEALALLTDPARSPHAHPQYGLVKLLGPLGVRPDAVTELGPSRVAPRTMIIRQALAPAEFTANWLAERDDIGPLLINGALESVAVLAARGEGLEARAIAIAARDTLGRGGTVGIISPDRNL